MSASASKISRKSSPPARRASKLALSAFLMLVVCFAAAAPAPADLQSKLDAREAKLAKAKDQRGVLTTEVSRVNDQLDRLTGEVAALRNREAAVQAELDQAEADLEVAEGELKQLRERLARSIGALQDRLVDIYKTDEPDAITTLLESDGFDDAIGRYEYLQSIQAENADIVGRVRELRDETAATVDRVRTTRDAIASRKQELERTRAQLEIREADLDAARARSEAQLEDVNGNVDRLEGDVNQFEKKIQARLAAIAQAQSGVPALPAGAVQQAGSGFIWPVNGPIVSPFGMRWGTLHAGVDIAVPAGTPIRAANAGTIVLSQTEAASGGYGNYTCIDHGGGVSTCYAHQSSFAITSGPIQQGDVIGYVGCTGHCFGDHLHFEVRINGVPVDPMGYL